MLALNSIRLAAGLPTVKLSQELSEGCSLHARYLALNWGTAAVEGLKAHQEQADTRGFTEKGKKAGARSVINYVSPSDSVDWWIGTFYHRVPLLQPDLSAIGIGYARGGPGWIAVVDCTSSYGQGADAPYVLYPARNQRGVPRAFAGEIPSPVPAGVQAGFPITVSFSGNPVVRSAALRLTDKNGRQVKGYYSDPEHPATFFDQWRSLCFIPAEALEPGARYTAAMSAVVDGKHVSETWSFTTVKQ